MYIHDTAPTKIFFILAIVIFHKKTHIMLT